MKLGLKLGSSVAATFAPEKACTQRKRALAMHSAVRERSARDGTKKTSSRESSNAKAPMNATWVLAQVPRRMKAA